MATRKRCPLVKINFDFSDESEDDSIINTSHEHAGKVLQELKCAPNFKTSKAKLHMKGDDKSVIVSNNQQKVSDLPSFCEVFESPVTESTRLSSIAADLPSYLEDELEINGSILQSEVEKCPESFVKDMPQSVADSILVLISPVNKPHSNAATNLDKKKTNTTRHLKKQQKKVYEKSLKTNKENIDASFAQELCNNDSRVLGQTSETIVRIQPSPNVSATHNMQVLDWDDLPETPLKESRSAKRHRLYKDEVNFTPVHTNERRSKNINPLLHGKLATSKGEAPHCVNQIHSVSGEIATDFLHDSRSDSESYIEVQDVSIQTSLVSDNGNEIDEGNNNDSVLSNEPEIMPFNYSTPDQSLSFVEVQDVSVQANLDEHKDRQRKFEELEDIESSSNGEVSGASVSIADRENDNSNSQECLSESFTSLPGSQHSDQCKTSKTSENLSCQECSFTGSSFEDISSHSYSKVIIAQSSLGYTNSSSENVQHHGFDEESELMQSSYEVQDVSAQTSHLNSVAVHTTTSNSDSSSYKYLLDISDEKDETDKNSLDIQQVKVSTILYESAVENLTFSNKNSLMDDSPIEHSPQSVSCFSNHPKLLQYRETNKDLDDEYKDYAFNIHGEATCHVLTSETDISNSDGGNVDDDDDDSKHSSFSSSIRPDLDGEYKNSSTDIHGSASSDILVSATDSEKEDADDAGQQQQDLLVGDGIDESDNEESGECSASSVANLGMDSVGEEQTANKPCVKLDELTLHKQNSTCGDHDSFEVEENANMDHSGKAVMKKTDEPKDLMDDNETAINEGQEDSSDMHHSREGKQVYGKAKEHAENYQDNQPEEEDMKPVITVRSKCAGNSSRAATCSIGSLSNELAAVALARTGRKDSTSSDDDSFENFLSRVKSTVKSEKVSVPEKEILPMDEFIMDDNEATSGLSGGEEDSEDEDIDDTAYLKTNNILEARTRVAKVPGLKCLSDNSDVGAEDDSESDLDSFIVNKPISSKNKVPMFDLSSDDDCLLDEGSPIIGKNKKEINGPKKKRVISKDASMPDEKEVLELERPDKGEESAQREKPRAAVSPDPKETTRETPFKTPFKTPHKPSKLLKLWDQPFETPAGIHTSKDFRTPQNSKGPRTLAATAPRPPRLSSVGLDDDAYFLKSLTTDYADYKRHPDARRYIKHFKSMRVELTQRLFRIFNHAVFDDKLCKDFEIEWSTRYTKTAGTFSYKGTATNYKTKVTLSVKICDSAERVRDTLAHELCHAAVKLINGVNESHGKFWRSWARRTNRTFSFMPVIARCHDYVIRTKYTYLCVQCKYRIGRHSKSLDTDKKVCGHCLGKFEVYLTSELNSSSESCKTPATPQTPRTPNKFALFVKECYSDVKKRDTGLKHGDVMRILSKEFAEKNKIDD